MIENLARARCTYRKPSSAGHTIPSDSALHQSDSMPIEETNFKSEWKTIEAVTARNGYRMKMVDRIPQ